MLHGDNCIASRDQVIQISLSILTVKIIYGIFFGVLQCGRSLIGQHMLLSFATRYSRYTKYVGTSIPSFIKALIITYLTASKQWKPVNCSELAMISPPQSTIRRYPHHEFFNPSPHSFIGSLYATFERSQVLNAHGTNNSSAARLILGSANIRPALLHPCHPFHSTKLQNMGLPVVEEIERAFRMSPWRWHFVRFT